MTNSGKRWRVRYGKNGMRQEVWKFFATEKEARVFYTKVSRHPSLIMASIGHMVDDTASAIQSLMNAQIMEATGFRVLWNRTPARTRNSILKKQRNTLRVMIEDLLP